MIPSKKELSERDICTKFITPAIKNAGWNTDTQMLEVVFFTDGKITVRGNITSRGTRKRADYILYYKPNIPIAVIEAKDNKHNNGDGIQQANLKSCNLKLLSICYIFSAINFFKPNISSRKRAATTKSNSLAAFSISFCTFFTCFKSSSFVIYATTGSAAICISCGSV